ncbi:helix-turn-helix transcriptional regulator [Moritella viscosa]|uniref:Uncharacterized protein n=1 Tax=Moritella viscosa TaxID=80854 RepID=A0A1L0AJK9_9GAMM|nr:helix-turn-helix transcriptional regulator [Moritella viscosa]SGZ17365.1 Putative uncharacterized protein [Moritella viscosa]
MEIQTTERVIKKRIFYIQSNVDELKELYENDGMSKKKLAKHFDVDRAAIRYQVRKHGMVQKNEI